MTTSLNKKYVLVLSSALWQPIGYTTIRNAIKAMFSDQQDGIQALDLAYPLDQKTGYIDFSEPVEYTPTNIDKWLTLPIRDFDIPIYTAKRTIRAPIVVLTHNCKKMIFEELKPTRRNVWEFYDHKCIWTGKEIPFSECTLEHMTPKSHKGESNWLNLAPATKKINHERGATPLNKWKYKPQYQLKEPIKTPKSATIKDAVRPEWKYFLVK